MRKGRRRPRIIGGPSGHSAEHQVVLTYLGLFEYAVGSATALCDANTTLFVTGGRDFADRHPLPRVGHASIIITPAQHILDEVCRTPSVAAHQAFRRSTGPSSADLRLLTHRLLSLPANDNPLVAEELTIRALRQSLSAARKGATAPRVVRRAKEILHARGCEPISLDEIAREVGVSAVYLTQEFTRSEGLPLYRYQTRLRLGHALVELPHCNDITRLALDLGFSSHSHFSSVFKAALGVTPSQFRDSHRGRARSDLFLRFS
jgi:AraC family transcriptional regulator